MTAEETIEKAEKEGNGLMTAEDLEKWNEWRLKNLKPLRPGHWTHKRARRVRLVRICLEWREACQYWREQCFLLTQARDNLRRRVEELENENYSLSRDASPRRRK